MTEKKQLFSASACAARTIVGSAALTADGGGSAGQPLSRRFAKTPRQRQEVLGERKRSITECSKLLIFLVATIALLLPGIGNAQDSKQSPAPAPCKESVSECLRRLGPSHAIHPSRMPVAGQNICGANRADDFRDLMLAISNRVLNPTAYQLRGELACDSVAEFKLPGGSSNVTIYRIKFPEFCRGEFCLTIVFDRAKKAISFTFDSSSVLSDNAYGANLIESIDGIIHNKFRYAGIFRYIFSTRYGEIFVGAHFDLPVVGIVERQ